MKRLFMVMFVVMAVAATGCSQSKQNGNFSESAAIQSNTADTLTEKQSQTEDSSAGKVSHLTTADFKKKVMNYEKHQKEWVFEGSRPAVIDFYATWCHPCKLTSPIVEQLANEYQGKIDFYKIDIDKEPELAAVFGIRSVPTFLFIPVKGTPTMQLGAMPKTEFEKIIKSVFVK